jgi:aminobenzoyl-glutamate transport protein
MADVTPDGQAGSRRSLVDRFLTVVERVGNALPHPGTLFLLMALSVVLVSEVASWFHLSVVHPATGETILPVSLFSVDGLHRMITEAVANFTGFAPLGTVLVAMIGIGLAEASGLLGTALRLLVLSAPQRLLTPIIVFAGVMSNTAGEIGYVLLVPLAAMIFLAAGRHPIAGLAAAFAGVSGGYSANLLLGTLDPLLAGLSQEAARIVDPEYVVNPACNYYFLAVSTVLITGAGTFVTERIVVPRLGSYAGGVQAEAIEELSADERRGLKYALWSLIALTVIVLAGLLPSEGFLRESGTGSILRSPFLRGIVFFIFLLGAVTGTAYGIGAKTIRNDTQVMDGMGKALATLGGYMVLVFFAAQFVAYFNWTNLGLIFAVEGAQFLRGSGLSQIPLFMSFIVLSSVVNLGMGSASAKWAIMAPVFIPMFMLVGYSPEFTQVAYRIGDSVTNIIAPMMTYFALIVAFVQKYEHRAGIGTVIATMLPYTITFLIGWAILLSVWMLFGLPIGPGAGLYLQAP